VIERSDFFKFLLKSMGANKPKIILIILVLYLKGFNRIFDIFILKKIEKIRLFNIIFEASSIKHNPSLFCYIKFSRELSFFDN